MSFAVKFGAVPGAPVIAADNATRTSQLLTSWPDGILGRPVNTPNVSYNWFAANRAQDSRTVGSLNSLTTAGSTTPTITIQYQPYDGGSPRYSYAGGGPVIGAPDGSLLQVVHAEQWIGGNPNNIYSVFAMARSTDYGRARSWATASTTRPTRPTRSTGRRAPVA
jgi:hypothetical protein